MELLYNANIIHWMMPIHMLAFWWMVDASSPLVKGGGEEFCTRGNRGARLKGGTILPGLTDAIFIYSTMPLTGGSIARQDEE